MKHQPTQPVVVDPEGVVRFQQNAIVSYLLDFSNRHGFGLNEMAGPGFSREDRCQLAQLIGYSVAGYHDLSYVRDAEREGEAMSETTEELDCEALLDLLKMKARAAKRLDQQVEGVQRQAYRLQRERDEAQQEVQDVLRRLEARATEGWRQS